MSKITIGDHNKIEKSSIGNHNEPVPQSFIEKYIIPIITATIAAIIAGVLLMFEFWPDIIVTIENLCKSLF